jgi:hypothetical protein
MRATWCDDQRGPTRVQLSSGAIKPLGRRWPCRSGNRPGCQGHGGKLRDTERRPSEHRAPLRARCECDVAKMGATSSFCSSSNGASVSLALPGADAIGSGAVSSAAQSNACRSVGPGENEQPCDVTLSFLVSMNYHDVDSIERRNTGQPESTSRLVALTQVPLTAEWTRVVWRAQ